MTSKQITELFVIWLGFRSCAEFGPLQVPSWGGKILLTRADPGQSDFNNVGTQPSVPKQIDLQPDPPALPGCHLLLWVAQTHLLMHTGHGEGGHTGRPMKPGEGQCQTLQGLTPWLIPISRVWSLQREVFLVKTIISALKPHPLGL